MISFSEQKGSLVPSAAPPGSVVVLACRDNHQEVKGFFFFFAQTCLLGFMSAFNAHGGARHVVATWLVLGGGFNAPLRVTLGFPAFYFYFYFF